MEWNTAIELNLFNAIKSAIVFVAVKPLTTFSIFYISSVLAASLLRDNGVVKLNTLGPFAPLFDGFTISYVPNRRSVLQLLKNVALLIFTVWASTGAEVLFEYGISSFSQPVSRVMTVRSTSSGSSDITYTEGRDDVMAQIGLLERSCETFNTLSSFTDVFVHPQSPNVTYCSPQVFVRSVCASGRTLEGERCDAPMFPNVTHAPNIKPTWTAETWLSLIFASKRWSFVSDGSEEDNGYVTFEPFQAEYGLDDSQLFVINTDDAHPISSLQLVHCSSGSSLLPGHKAGLRPFQVCLWEFEDHLLITHADYLQGVAKEGYTFGNGVSEDYEGVREILNNVTELQISARGRWISFARHARSKNQADGSGTDVNKRPTLIPRDIMLALGLARPLVKFSSDDGVSFFTDTYEIGMWASASMTLRLIERALARGISIQNDGDVVDVAVVSNTRQIATVSVGLLTQYIASVFALSCLAVLLGFCTRKAPNIRLDLLHLLGLWQLDRDGGKLFGKGPTANIIALNRTDEGDNVRVLHQKDRRLSSDAMDAERLQNVTAQ